MSHDEQGNPLPDVDPLSSAGQLIALLEYCRRRGFRIGPYVKIGDVALQVQDLRQDMEAGRGVPREPEIGPWAAAGWEEGDK